MSIKLSELLEAAATGAELADTRLDFCAVYGQAADTLRAIVPALVVAVAEVCERHRNEDGESLHPVNGCGVCALTITLEEAGVTCD